MWGSLSFHTGGGKMGGARFLKARQVVLEAAGKSGKLIGRGIHEDGRKRSMTRCIAGGRGADKSIR